jgi:hypothetical protein
LSAFSLLEKINSSAFQKIYLLTKIQRILIAFPLAFATSCQENNKPLVASAPVIQKEERPEDAALKQWDGFVFLRTISTLNAIQDSLRFYRLEYKMYSSVREYVNDTQYKGRSSAIGWFSTCPEIKILFVPYFQVEDVKLPNVTIAFIDNQIFQVNAVERKPKTEGDGDIRTLQKLYLTKYGDWHLSISEGEVMDESADFINFQLAANFNSTNPLKYNSPNIVDQILYKKGTPDVETIRSTYELRFLQAFDKAYKCVKAFEASEKRVKDSTESERKSRSLNKI